jgi:hypothetical protein
METGDRGLTKSGTSRNHVTLKIALSHFLFLSLATSAQHASQSGMTGWNVLAQSPRRLLLLAVAAKTEAEVATLAEEEADAAADTASDEVLLQ